MALHKVRPRIYEVTEGDDKGWWFEYTTLDYEVTEDGPFKTYAEASDALAAELEELFIEGEGEVA